MTARSPAHRRLLLVLMLVGLSGFAGLIAWSGHVPLHADLIRFFALVWLMVFGAARILVHLDTMLQDGALHDEAPDTDHWSRLRGRGDL
ncbi:hypothetical protein [Caulobacter segnis]